MEGKKFMPIDLTEENVTKVYAAVSVESTISSDSYVINLVEVEGAYRVYHLSKTKLQEEERNIRYLLGQLAIVHKKYSPHKPFDLTEVGRKYEVVRKHRNSYGESSYWTTNPEIIITLLTMASFFGVTCPIDKWGKTFITRLATDKITATLSPYDLEFFHWWITERTDWGWPPIERKKPNE